MARLVLSTLQKAFALGLFVGLVVVIGSLKRSDVVVPDQERYYQRLSRDESNLDIDLNQIYRNLIELKDFVNVRFDSIEGSTEKKENLKDTLESARLGSIERLRYIQAKLENVFYQSDIMHERRAKRRNKAKEIEQRLNELQNVGPCQYNNLAVFKLKHECGYGCRLHHLLVGTIIAYGLNRTLVLVDRRVLIERPFEDYFKPMSESCKDLDPSSPLIENAIYLGEANHNKLSYYENMRKDLSEISQYHDEPLAWYAGQFVKYIMRFNNKTLKFLQESAQLLGLKHPYVGFHVRRTDKVSEAAFFQLKDYLKPAQEFFDLYNLQARIASGREQKIEQSVYLATDEKAVYLESRENHKAFNFIFDSSQVSSPSPGFMQLLTDIYHLSNADQLVCTFSSNLCRLIYELMVGRADDEFNDFTKRVRSLDTQYYVVCDLRFFAQAIMSNSNKEYESTPTMLTSNPCQTQKDTQLLDFEKGDIIETFVYNGWKYDGYYQNGCMYGVNNRTKQRGYFASYKVVDYFA